jgi:hypothetical protein
MLRARWVTTIPPPRVLSDTLTGWQSNATHQLKLQEQLRPHPLPKAPCTFRTSGGTRRRALTTKRRGGGAQHLRGKAHTSKAGQPGFCGLLPNDAGITPEVTDAILAARPGAPAPVTAAGKNKEKEAAAARVQVSGAAARAPPWYAAMKKLRIVILGFGAARQKGSLNDGQIQNPSKPFGIVPLSNFVPRGLGFGHHSIAILYHEVPNPYLTIRNFFIAVW